MVHDATWLVGRRLKRLARLAAPVGFLLTCMLVAGLPATASASTPEMRGEWELTIAAEGTVKGRALIVNEANAEEKFASQSALFGGAINGTFSGTLEGGKASVKLTSEAYPPVAEAAEFVSSTMTIGTSDGLPSISGSGELTSGSKKAIAMVTAVRLRTYKEIEEQQAKEKLEQLEQEEREAREKAERETREREAKAKAEQEAKAKAELEAKIKTEQEAQAKAELEAQAKAELEAKAKAELEARTKVELEAKARAEQEAKARAELEARKKQELEVQKRATLAKAVLGSIQLTGRTFAVSAAGLLPLPVSNPNAYAISARITLAVAESAKAGKTSSARIHAGKRWLPLGSVSFGISPAGKQLVKLDLTQTGRAELTRHKTLRALATILTKASGQSSTTKTLTLTLSAGKAA